ncbi:pyridoxamine 5'-phosphate oxidase [Profundibacterium mesophilum]|uniref:Pyridoxine/pyridoxamine 5'-phosphate oxidase n=1 Tax=Profundibacterium mesophilum KAUST100406-0324 TaxID=1037889 RepID=A0A921NU70_9RHOB|nr:pyridoxamine 5'-phosphate oxidase [Profundibacterium mesophilum]KAF0676714.1 Pyridoxinepyridoxamine 5'-phosphate oxidase [Profundibacterium mesophilum KAUST100406-0324]
MTARQSIFGAKDPFALTRAWMAEAEKSELNDPNAMAVATVDETGMPNVRIVLLKSIEDDAFVFYTNYESRKAREIGLSGKIAFVLHWKSLRRQVRVRGTAEREDGAPADAYYASRALDSRLGAWASRQSRPLGSREELMADVEAARAEHGANPSRPPFWGGFRIRPTEFEFWADGAFRLHDRERWTQGFTFNVWEKERLYP